MFIQKWNTLNDEIDIMIKKEHVQTDKTDILNKIDMINNSDINIDVYEVKVDWNYSQLFLNLWAENIYSEYCQL